MYPHQELCNRVVQSKQYIDRHFARPLSLGEIAEHAFISKYHYIRVFKSCYGLTPHRYLSEVRVARAKKLLQSGMTVTEACFTVGFDSVTSFTALVKKLTGSTPQALRSKTLREKQF